MNDDELGRLLSGAFDAQARHEVGDDAPVPPPAFASDDLQTRLRARHPKRWPVRLALPLTAAAAVVALVVAVFAVVGHGPGRGSHPQAARGDRPGPTVGRAALVGSGEPVRISLLNVDDSVVGVGMPVIAYLSKKITDAQAMQDETTVTVNGRPTVAAWYFEPSASKGHPLEAHLRPRTYWPANSSIHVHVDTKGLTAGTGLKYANGVTLSFRTGARHVVTVDNRTHRLTLVSDGTRLSYPVSLGSARTPTTRGIKVIMQKGLSICMSGPGYDACGIKYTQRLTYGGEYLHSAPWNVTNIRDGVDSSNGCTNLLPADARHLYQILRVGDVVDYPDATGPAMTAGAGFGDWNVPWSTWLRGGAVPTR